MKNLRSPIILVSLLLSLTTVISGCSSSKNEGSVPAPTSFKFDGVEYKFTANGQTPAQAEVVKFAATAPGNGQSDETIRVKTLALIADQHAKASKSAIAASDISNFVASVGLNANSSPVDLKIALEKKINEKFSPNLMKYNKAMVSAGDILTADQMQCYSGSILYSLAAQTQVNSVASLKSTVLIFRPGHVLPGYIGPNATGENHLFGIESTVEGKGLMDFGSIANPLPVDVVVAETKFALLADGLRGILSDVVGLRKQIIEKSAKDLGLTISTDALKIFDSVSPQATSNFLNASVFAFGSVEIPEGAMARTIADSLSPYQTPPNYTSWNYSAGANMGNGIITAENSFGYDGNQGADGEQGTGGLPFYSSRCSAIEQVTERRFYEYRIEFHKYESAIEGRSVGKNQAIDTSLIFDERAPTNAARDFKTGELYCIPKVRCKGPHIPGFDRNNNELSDFIQRIYRGGKFEIYGYNQITQRGKIADCSGCGGLRLLKMEETQTNHDDYEFGRYEDCMQNEDTTLEKKESGS